MPRDIWNLGTCFELLAYPIIAQVSQTCISWTRLKLVPLNNPLLEYRKSLLDLALKRNQ